ncbi:MAG: hypothetical protein QXN03_00235 [Desulfurococcaceae archaeon]
MHPRLSIGMNPPIRRGRISKLVDGLKENPSSFKTERKSVQPVGGVNYFVKPF